MLKRLEGCGDCEFANPACPGRVETTTLLVGIGPEGVYGTGVAVVALCGKSFPAGMVESLSQDQNPDQGPYQPPYIV